MSEAHNPVEITTPSKTPKRPINPNLIPWKPGQTGNPGGRGNLERETRRIARDASPDIMRRLVEIALDPNEDTRVASVVGLAVLRQAYGEPPQYRPGDDKPPGQFDYSALSDRQLRGLKKLVMKGAKLPADVAKD